MDATVYFQLIPVNGSLKVEGENPALGEFRGHVLAIGMRDYDPVASPRDDRAAKQSDEGSVEGLWGWGTTHFLVADPDRPAPIWVSKEDVSRHVFEAAGVASGA